MPLSEMSCRRSAIGVVTSKSPSLLQSAITEGPASLGINSDGKQFAAVKGHVEYVCQTIMIGLNDIMA